MRLCEVDGCDRPHIARGMCTFHYDRWRRGAKERPIPYRYRFKELCAFSPDEGENGCWLWQGTIIKGYPYIYDGKRLRRAHRWWYEKAVGPIPEGYTLDHLCRVKHCVNPLHLEPVTSRENTLRSAGLSAVNAAKTHCNQGHEFTAGNTLTSRQPNGLLRRTCSECNRGWQKAAYYRRTRKAVLT